MSKRVVVVGAGISGLTLARDLTRAGIETVVLEARPRVGGQIDTACLPTFDHLRIDVGAESVHLGNPDLHALVREVGLAGSVVASRPGASRLVADPHSPAGWASGRPRLVPLPAGVGPFGPTRLGPLWASGLLTPWEFLRAAMEPVLARPVTTEISVGHFVSARFGRAVTREFVDPLLGNLHAGDVDRLSLACVAPRLLALARSGESILRHDAPAPPSSAQPAFASWATGLATLPDAVAADVDVRCDTPAITLERSGGGWVVASRSAEFAADRVVLTAPAASSAHLVRPHVEWVAETLALLPTASTATITLAYPRQPARRALPGNGLLLSERQGRLVKAATFLSNKWERLDHPDFFVVRASVGRAGSDAVAALDDARMARQVHRDLSELTGLDAAPLAWRVRRWPGALPQLEVGFGAKIERLRRGLDGTGIVLAGAAYDGLGLASVVRSARATAAAVAADLTD